MHWASSFIYIKFQNLQNQQLLIEVRILLPFGEEEDLLRRVLRRASELPAMFYILAWMALIICVHIVKTNTQFSSLLLYFN